MRSRLCPGTDSLRELLSVQASATQPSRAFTSVGPFTSRSFTASFARSLVRSAHGSRGGPNQTKERRSMPGKAAGQIDTRADESNGRARLRHGPGSVQKRFAESSVHSPEYWQLTKLGYPEPSKAWEKSMHPSTLTWSDQLVPAWQTLSTKAPYP